MAKSKGELTRCNGTMTEAQYLAWIRSALRGKTLMWKPRNQAIQNARRAYKGTNKLQKWEVQCAICTNWFKLKEIQVDHYPLDAGSILSVDDIGQFCNRLFCEVDNLRCLCKDCHSQHTLSHKLGISFEEALIEKEIIRIMKEEKASDIVDFIQANDYDGVLPSNNAKARRESVSIILRRNTHDN